MTGLIDYDREKNNFLRLLRDHEDRIDSLERWVLPNDILPPPFPPPDPITANGFNRIILVPSSLSDEVMYEKTAAGLTSALAAASSADMIWIPPCTLVGDFTVPAGVGLVAWGIQTELQGLISLGANAFMHNMTIERSASSGSVVAGVQCADSGINILNNCRVNVTNIGAGNGIGVQMGGGGAILWNCWIEGSATGGGDGYGIVTDDGECYMEGGWLLGSTAPADVVASSFTEGSAISSGSITPSSEVGHSISGLTVDSWYSIEITGDGYRANPAAFPDQYLTHIQLSNDGGSSWSTSGGFGATSNDDQVSWIFSTLYKPNWVIFTEVVDDRHLRFYFRATTTSIKIRASDIYWADNDGELGWELNNAAVTLGNLIVHAVRMETVVGEPAQGDRSTWDAADYPNRHANDIDTLTGIHHTLGEGSGQAAAGNHTHSALETFTPNANFYIDGRLAVVSEAGGAFIFAAAVTVLTIYVYLSNSGSAGTTIIDMNLNGTTVFTDQDDRPQIAHNDSDRVAFATPLVVAVDPFDVLTFDIDQVATGAEGLSIVVEFGEATSSLPALPDYVITDDDKPGTGTDNVVLSLGSSGQWDDGYITAPCVVVKDGVVYLFFGGNDGTNERIGVATANVPGFTGINFSKYGSNPILGLGSGGAWDDAAVSEPWVIYDQEEEIWKMWYTGGDGSGNNKVGYATASDPFGPWTKYGSNPVLQASAGWEGTKILAPIVIKESSTSYKMLYTGNDVVTGSDIGLATSPDGISWTKYASNPVLTNSGSGWRAKSVLTPHTLYKVGGTYYLYFAGKVSSSPDFSTGGFAYSTDLITWIIPSVNPILEPTRSWEGATNPPGEVEYPTAVYINGNWYIFYFCWWGTPKTIGVAVVSG